MRKLLWLSAAFAIIGAGTALASGSQSVQIQATVTTSCSVTDPADVTFPNNPLPGATANRTFSFTCNFAGNDTGALLVKFVSTNGGLLNPAESIRRGNHNVVYGLNTLPASTLTGAGFLSAPETSGTANVAENRSFDVTLVDSLNYAGLYADTLQVSIAP